MTTPESRYLDAFPTWLRSLAEDARKLADVLESGTASETAQRSAAVALNYLFKSLDLIPDGLEDLGFIDDAFVLRVAAATATASDESTSEVLGALAAETDLIREYLGEDYPRLAQYCASLEGTRARGRSVADILGDATERANFLREVRQWADGYAAPAFARDARSLVKLKSFMAAKLPR